MTARDDVEVIRARPAMFIGDVQDGSGLLHMVYELLANSVDQHLAGECSHIDVVVHEDGSLSVQDDGAGISLADYHGRPWLEHVLTRLHDTATADGHAPHVHLRPYHIGLCAVSALSSSFVATTHWQGGRWRIELAKGRVRCPAERIGDGAGRGSTFRFTPDSSVMASTRFDVGAIRQRLRELSALLPGLSTGFRCERQTNALSLADLLGSSLGSQRLHPAPLVGEFGEGELRGRVALEWRRGSPGEVRAYCNLLPIESGTPMKGLRKALRRMKVSDEGLHAVLSIQLFDPEYAGPTKAQITSPDAGRIAEAAVCSALERAFDADPSLRERLPQR